VKSYLANQIIPFHRSLLTATSYEKTEQQGRLEQISKHKMG